MVLNLLIPTVVYKLITKNRLWSEAFFFGVLVWLGTIVFRIVLSMLSFTFPQNLNFIMIPLEYFLISFLLQFNSRFRTDEKVKVSLWIAGAVLVMQILASQGFGTFLGVQLWGG